MDKVKSVLFFENMVQAAFQPSISQQIRSLTQLPTSFPIAPRSNTPISLFWYIIYLYLYLNTSFTHRHAHIDSISFGCVHLLVEWSIFSLIIILLMIFCRCCCWHVYLYLAGEAHPLPFDPPTNHFHWISHNNHKIYISKLNIWKKNNKNQIREEAKKMRTYRNGSKMNHNSMETR